MIRILCLASLSLLTLTAFSAVPLPAAAESPGVRSQPILLSAMAGAQVEVAAEHLIVFHNDASATSRVVFKKSDRDGVDCQESAGVNRARTGQYTVQPGADLLCSLEPGSYRYETLTQQNGTIERADSRVRVN